MKLITAPLRLLLRLALLPVKLLLVSLGLTFRTGYKAGSLPVKGGVRAGRALGLKAVVLFALGLVVGVALGRRLGAPAGPGSGPELAPGGPRATGEGARAGRLDEETEELDGQIAEALGETPGESVADAEDADV